MKSARGQHLLRAAEEDVDDDRSRNQVHYKEPYQQMERQGLVDYSSTLLVVNIYQLSAICMV